MAGDGGAWMKVVAILLWLAALLLAPSARAQAPWFDECGTAVAFQVEAGHTKPNGKPWDGPFSASGFFTGEAPDISFCAGGARVVRCRPRCPDAYTCDALWRDPPVTVIVQDDDVLQSDPIATCTREGQAWSCAAVSGSRATATVIANRPCLAELDRRLRRAEAAGCSLQIPIWTESLAYRQAFQQALPELKELFADRVLHLPGTLRDLLDKADSAAEPPDPQADLAATLAAKPSSDWLPTDWLRFAIVLSIASTRSGEPDGLYPVVPSSVRTACAPLYR